MTVPRGLAEHPDGRLIFGEDCTAADDSCGSLRALDTTTGDVSLFAPPASASWVIVNPVSLVFSQ